MDPVLAFILSSIVVPILVAEYGEVSPALAKRLLKWGAGRLGSQVKTERYTEEWLADLERVPGKIAKLGWAIGVVASGVLRLREPASAREWVQPAAPLPFATDSVFGPGNTAAPPPRSRRPRQTVSTPPSSPLVPVPAVVETPWSIGVPEGIGSMRAYRQWQPPARSAEPRHPGERFFQRYQDTWGSYDYHRRIPLEGDPLEMYGDSPKAAPPVIGD